MQEVKYQNEHDTNLVENTYHEGGNKKILGEMEQQLSDIEANGGIVREVKRRPIAQRYIDAMEISAAQSHTVLPREEVLKAAYQLQMIELRRKQAKQASARSIKKAKNRRKAKTKARKRNQK